MRKDEIYQEYFAEISQYSTNIGDIRQSFTEEILEKLIFGLDRTRSWIDILGVAYHDLEITSILSVISSSAIEIPVLIGLGFFHGAFANLRAILDMTCSFSYYVDHPIEFLALKSEKVNWVGRKKILDFHISHLNQFNCFGDSLSSGNFSS
jgi:endoglucanase Acf2